MRWHHDRIRLGSWKGRGTVAAVVAADSSRAREHACGLGKASTMQAYTRLPCCRLLLACAVVLYMCVRGVASLPVRDAAVPLFPALLPASLNEAESFQQKHRRKPEPIPSDHTSSLVQTR